MLNFFMGDFSPWMMVFFASIIGFSLWMDLKSHNDDKPITIKNSLIWSGIWIGLALCFSGYLWYSYGVDKSSAFLAGYFLEKSLSIDNLFVMMAIFGSFGIINTYQHRALYYGILGALVLRMLFIAFGTSLAALSEWVLVGFGAFVLFTAWKMYSADGGNEEIEDYSDHYAVKWTKKIFPVSLKLDGHNFFTLENGKRFATPLFLSLVCIEFSDVAFAFDSVPAVIAVTKDPLLVYTSNIFAILGLRSLYFVLMSAKDCLVHLEKAVIGILVFIGLKMILGAFGIIHISPNVSLAVVLGGLTLGILASKPWENFSNLTLEEAK
jgi:tellurite resistance protein TerC